MVTVTSTYRPTVQSPSGESVELENPFEIVRFEEDEDRHQVLRRARHQVRFPASPND